MHKRIRIWCKRLKRRHPLPWWGHVCFVAAYVPGYLFFLELDEMAAPDATSKLVIAALQLFFFYTAILLLLPLAFRYRRGPMATAAWMMIYLVLDFLVVAVFLFAISVGSGAIQLYWDEGGDWLYDVINFPAVAVATCYLAGLASVIYQLIAQGLIFYHHRANLTVLVDRKQAAIRALELEWRRLQLDPHLMAGLLSRIRLMAHRDPMYTWKALNKTIAIMQYYCSISPATPVIPLAEEVKQVRNFLAMETLGHPDSYFRLQVADEALPCTIIPMLLLMLVKNQIKHGVLHDRQTPAVLCVSTCHGGNCLHIITLNGINRSPRTEFQDTGIGQKNIRYRLAHYYPGRYIFRSGEDADGRYRVEICIGAGEQT
ncbi:histidine kinase [Parapedobacter koreensis]|nr:histidine kinase [Parapedobacter koreensis]